LPARAKAQHNVIIELSAFGARSGRVAWQFIQDLAGRMWGELID